MIGVLRWGILPVLLLLDCWAHAQPAPPPDSGVLATSPRVQVQRILISGNKRTRPAAILRELPFEEGSLLATASLHDLTERAERRLMNTGLFLKVIVRFDSTATAERSASIELIEKWYLWPKPVLRPVDRNLRQWWFDKGRDPSRVNYGLRLVQNNLSGNNDQLRLNLINGFTREVTLQYFGLFLDPARRWSMSAGLSVGGNREMNYGLRNNKQLPLRTSNFVRRYREGFAEIAFRPAIKTRHALGISFREERLADTIARLNPYYSFQAGSIRYPEFRYSISYADVDFLPYPTRGVMTEAALLKRGFGGHQSYWQLQLKGARTFQLPPKFYLNLRALGLLTMPFRQPQMNRTFIGYNDRYLQGYEDYVIDGVAGGYAKATLARELTNTHMRLSKGKITRLKEVPLRIYAKVFANAGYVYDRFPGPNALTNVMLATAGVGMDVVLCTDFILRFEWSFNRIGENGLYLHQRNYF